MKVEFKVAMDKEQAALKNHHNVVLEVGKCDDETMLKYAMKAYIVELQSQIRSNWDTFIEGTYPRELIVGEPMFKSTRGHVTQAKAQEAYKAKVNSMSMVQKLRTLLDDGMIDVDMYEISIEKLFAKDEITQEEFDEAMDI